MAQPLEEGGSALRRVLTRLLRTPALLHLTLAQQLAVVCEPPARPLRRLPLGRELGHRRPAPLELEHDIQKVLKAVVDNPSQPGALRATARGKLIIKRLDYGIGQNEWAGTGQVANEVTIDLNVVASRPR